MKITIEMTPQEAKEFMVPEHLNSLVSQVQKTGMETFYNIVTGKAYNDLVSTKK